MDGFVWGTGRRKRSVARVRAKYGSGRITVNGKALEEFFPTAQAQLTVLRPLNVTDTREKYDIHVNVDGGGITGQCGATSLGIARALREAEPHLEPALREGGFLTRDSRMKERKKYGLRGARRAYQFSKR
ncbi:MAG: 30S ribosomal protein S9 [Planctomycetota bacterium JB042]